MSQILGRGVRIIVTEPLHRLYKWTGTISRVTSHGDYWCRMEDRLPNELRRFHDPKDDRFNDIKIAGDEVKRYCRLEAAVSTAANQ